MSNNSTTYNRILSKGIEGELPVTIGVNKLRFTTDTGRLYLDNEGTNRIEITDFVKGLTKNQILNILAPLPKIYLSSDTHELFVYNSTSHEWDSIQTSNASTAQYAVSAASATNASTADYSINASTTEYAENAGTSDYAYQSLYSTHAEDAQNASSADYAQNATSANYAENAYYAENAGTAEYVSYVENAGTADYASSANYAENATSADYASSANYAETADRANADEYGNFFTVSYAMLDSPIFTGTPTAPDVAAGDESEKIANTNFVSNAVATAIAGVTQFDYEVVTTLPDTGVKGKIYLVANGASTGQNIYDEYIWVTNKYEKIGTTEIDLSNYVNTVQATGTGNAVTGYSKNGSTLTLDKGASFLTAHPVVTHGSSTATATPAAGSTIDVITNITTDNFAHATSFVKTTVTLPNSVATATNASTADYAKNAASVTWNGVSDKPSAFAPVIGNAATQAAAGNHNHDGTYYKKTDTVANATNAATATYATTAGSANVVAWGNVSGKPDTYPPSSHTHTTNISTYAGGTGIDLELNSKYKLSTGDTSFTFSMPSKPTYDTNISTYAGASGIDLELNTKYKLSTGGTSFTFSMPSKPTYDTNISTYSGGVGINLENGKSYSLSTGGTSFKFKMPENPTSVSTATNASTADYAKAAPWSGITGTPSTYPPSAHSHDVFSTSANGFVPKPASTETGKFLKGDGTWASPSDADHQYFAGTGLNAASVSGNNTTFALATTGTAGTYGPSANVTGSNGTTIKVPQITTDAYGRVTAVTERTYTSVDTDTKVTAVGNHYTPATDNASSLSVNAASGTASWNTDVVKGVTIKRDAKGHVTGLEVSSVKIPANPNTDHLYYAGTGLNAASTSGNNTTFALATTGTAGTYGPTANVTGSNGSTIKVPQITTDAYGRVTAVTERTYTSVDHTYTISSLGGIPASQKGAASGVAELGSDGKVPSSQLPSYVDDVIEGATTASFPTTGEAGKIYVALDTNKTYRWGGTAYVEISPSLALGETSSTAYRGDRGKIAYDHSQAAHAPSNAQPNQNAFSNITVGSTTIAADTTTDTLTLAAGSNVTITPDATNDKITIAANNTTYDLSPYQKKAEKINNAATADYATSAGSAGSATSATNAATATYATTAGTANAVAWGNVSDKPGTYAPIIGSGSTQAAAGNHTHSAYVNQNAFSNVIVGSTTVAADTTTDTLTLAAGSNITLTPDATNDKVTIAANNTTYDLSPYQKKAEKINNAATADYATNAGTATYATTAGSANAVAWGNVSSKPNTYAPIIGSASTQAAAGNHTHSAYVNQNAFSNVVVGSTTVAADTTTDTLTLVAGSNVTLTPDATNDKVTIAASITNNVTGSGTSGYIAKWNGANTVTNGPAFGSATTTYLCNDGSWATPTDHQYFAGTALTTNVSGNNTTFNHTTYVTAGTAGTSSATSGSTLAVPYVTYNAQGHITAAGTHTHTISGFLASTTKYAISGSVGGSASSALAAADGCDFDFGEL